MAKTGIIAYLHRESVHQNNPFIDQTATLSCRYVGSLLLTQRAAWLASIPSQYSESFEERLEKAREFFKARNLLKRSKVCLCADG